MANPSEDILICSTTGKIYAINKTDGSQMWKSELSGIHDGVGSLFIFDDKVYVGMNGYLVALKLIDGKEVWRNSLPRMSYSEISLLVAPNSAEATSYGTQPPIVIVATYGKVCGISSATGDILWKSNLKNGGYGLPSVVLDSSAAVLVGCGKQLYKIDIHNGKTIWQKKISKSILGSTHVTMATRQSSLQAASTQTGFCNNPIAQYAIKEKEETIHTANQALFV
jgi:outer membrane protein assembly factor BamB